MDGLHCGLGTVGGKCGPSCRSQSLPSGDPQGKGYRPDLGLGAFRVVGSSLLQIRLIQTAWTLCLQQKSQLRDYVGGLEGGWQP